MWQDKCWGRTRCLISTPLFSRHELEVERWSPGASGFVVELQRDIVIGPVARLELWPEERTQAGGSEPLIEARMPAERFRQLGLRQGERLVVSPRRARVFLRETAEAPLP